MTAAGIAEFCRHRCQLLPTLSIAVTGGCSRRRLPTPSAAVTGVTRCQRRRLLSLVDAAVDDDVACQLWKKVSSLTFLAVRLQMFSRADAASRNHQRQQSPPTTTEFFAGKRSRSPEIICSSRDQRLQALAANAYTFNAFKRV